MRNRRELPSKNLHGNRRPRVFIAHRLAAAIGEGQRPAGMSRLPNTGLLRSRNALIALQTADQRYRQES